MPGAAWPRRVIEHVERFNAAVASGGWAEFVDRFAPDATMRFVGVPVPPASGRTEILAAYEARPPAEPIVVTGVRDEAGVDVVRFVWASGEPGTMRLRWAGDLVAELEVSFG